MATVQILDNAVRLINRRTINTPEIGIVLGSGLGAFSAKLENPVFIDYADIPDFPRSGVPGHRGRFAVGSLSGKTVVVLEGRVHYYEGHDMRSAVLPVRTACALGIRSLILTNAAGGINPAFKAGDFMLIRDHIASFVPSALRGENIADWGPRFPDMSEAYDAGLRTLIRETASDEGIALREGVYLQLPGPQFETPAEIRMLGALGADAVGMSTACECIAARHMGVAVAGLSCISNLASGISKTPLSHEEVQETADRVGDAFGRLLSGVIRRM